MFNDPSGILSTAAVLLGLAGSVGVGVQRGYARNLREQLADERSQKESLKAERTELRTEAARLHAEADALRATVTNEVLVQAISDLLEHHNNNAERHWRTEEARNEHLLELVDLIVDLIKAKGSQR